MNQFVLEPNSTIIIIIMTTIMMMIITIIIIIIIIIIMISLRPEKAGLMSNRGFLHLMGREILFSLGWQSF